MFQKLLERSFCAIRKSSSFHFYLFLISSALLALSFASNLRLRLDLLELDSKEFASVALMSKYKDEFKLSNNIEFYLAKKDGSEINGVQLCRIGDKLDEIGRRFGNSSMFDLRLPDYKEGKLWYRKVFSKTNCRSSLKQQSARLRAWNQLLWAGDGTDIVVRAVFSDQEIAQGALRSFKEELQSVEAEGFIVHMGGQAALKYYFYKAARKDSFVNLLVLLLLFTFFYWFFRSVKTFFYAATSLLLSALYTAGVMGALGFDVTLLNNNLFLMLSLATVQDLVFVFQDHKANGGEFDEALKRQILPCFLTTLTTVIGFLTLSFSPLGHIGEFGLEAAFAALLEWAVVFFVCPKIFSFPRRPAKETTAMKLTGLRLNGLSILLLLAVFFGSFAFMKKVAIQERPIENFSTAHEYTQASLYLKKSRDWESSVALVYDKDDAAAEKLRAELVAIEGVSDVYFAQDFLAHLTGGLESPEVRELVVREAQSAGLLGAFAGKRKKAAKVMLESHDLGFLREVLPKIKKVCADICEVVGSPVVYEEFTVKTVDYLSSSLMWCFAVIALFVGALGYHRFGSVRAGLSMVFGAVWGPVALLGILGLFEIPLQLTNSMVLTVLVGLTGDNVIHFLSGDMEKKASASLAMLLFMIGGGALFCLMDYVPMQKMGLVFMAGVALSFIGDYFIVKYFLEKFNKGKKTHGKDIHRSRDKSA